jgi:hypothetical protein
VKLNLWLWHMWGGMLWHCLVSRHLCLSGCARIYKETYIERWTKNKLWLTYCVIFEAWYFVLVLINTKVVLLLLRDTTHITVKTAYKH